MHHFFAAAALTALFVGTHIASWHHDQLNPDAMSYWSAARNFAHGQGLTWAIKPYFFPDDGVVLQPAVGRLSVTFTLLLGLACSCGLGFRAATILFSVIALMDGILVYVLASRLGGRTCAFLAAVLFLANPSFGSLSESLLTEPLALAFTLSGYLLASMGAFSPRQQWPAAAAAGFAMGLGYLTRPGDLVYFLSLLLAASLLKRWRSGGMLIVGFAAAAVPYWLENAALNGGPFFSMYAVLERTLFYGEATYTGFNRTFPGMMQFLAAHRPAIWAEIIRNYHLSETILLRAGNMGAVFTLVGGTAACSALIRRATRGRVRFTFRPEHWDRGLFGAMLSGAAMNMVATWIVWSTHEEERFLYGTWVLLLILAFAAVDRLLVTGSQVRPEALSRWAAGIMAVTVLGANVWLVTSQNIEWAPTREPTWREAEAARYRQICIPLLAGTRPTDVVAASDPWMVNYVCNRPTVLLPALRPGELPFFLAKYRVKWVAADRTRMPDPGDNDDFGRLARESWNTRDWRLLALASDRSLTLCAAGRQIEVYSVSARPETAHH